MLINFIDEVLAGTPEYTITHSDSSTEDVSIALKTVVQTQGTALNKGLFDKINSGYDLIGKYNTPTIEQSQSVSTGSYIPTYTSSTNPTGFEVTAGSYASNQNPWKALDNSTTTGWQGGTDSMTEAAQYWQIKLDTALQVKEIQVICSKQSSGYSNYGKLEASADGVNFEQIAIYNTPLTIYNTPQSSSLITNTISITSNKKYQYFRVLPCNQDGSFNATRHAWLVTFKITRWYTNTYGNQYTLSNYLYSLERGQRVLMLMPSSYVGGGISLNLNSFGYKSVIIPNTYSLQANTPLPLWYNGASFVLDDSMNY